MVYTAARPWTTAQGDNRFVLLVMFQADRLSKPISMNSFIPNLLTNNHLVVLFILIKRLGFIMTARQVGYNLLK